LWNRTEGTNWVTATFAPISTTLTNNGCTINGTPITNGAAITITGGSGGGISNVVVNGKAGVLSGSGSNVLSTITLVASDLGAVSNNAAGIAAAGGATNGQIWTAAQYPLAITNNQATVTLGTNLHLVDDKIVLDETVNDNMGLESVTYPVYGQASSVWMGYNALEISTGSWNTAIGTRALKQSAGNKNSGYGLAALQSSPGNENTAVGYLSSFVATGSCNAVLGATASYFAPGNYNSMFGYGAGYKTGGNSNVWIGAYAAFVDPTDRKYTNAIAIGAGAQPLGNNSTVLGNAQTVTTELKGNVGIGTNAPQATLHVVGGILVSNVTAIDTDNALKFPRGDGTWQSISAGGGDAYLNSNQTWTGGNVMSGQFRATVDGVVSNANLLAGRTEANISNSVMSAAQLLTNGVETASHAAETYAPISVTIPAASNAALAGVAASYVPQTRTVTINGVEGTLTSNLSWTVSGGTGDLTKAVADITYQPLASTYWTTNTLSVTNTLDFAITGLAANRLALDDVRMYLSTSSNAPVSKRAMLGLYRNSTRRASDMVYLDTNQLYYSVMSTLTDTAGTATSVVADASGIVVPDLYYKSIGTTSSWQRASNASSTVISWWDTNLYSMASNTLISHVNQFGGFPYYDATGASTMWFRLSFTTAFTGTVQTVLNYGR
jgi:hypothetical protein